jgi:hypothetical protein
MHGHGRCREEASMMGRIGTPEIVIALIIGLLSTLPVIVTVWVVLTLHRMRRLQEDMTVRLASIERLIQRDGD